MGETLIRFCVGGLVVSSFSLISDLLKPKTFAGLFGAAPSVALASLTLVVLTESNARAAIEARSMILGAVALLCYAAVVSYGLLRSKIGVIKLAFSALLLWLGVAVALWFAVPGA